MKLALYHNLSSGGARRAMVEMVKGLAQRGHQIDEFCPTTADRRFLPVDPFVRRTVRLPFQPRGVWTQRVPLLTPYLTAACLLADLAALSQVNRQVAVAIDAGNYDAIFVHDCQLSLNPDLLRLAQTPAVFYCHHGIVPRNENAGAAVPPRSLRQWLKSAYYALPVNVYPWWRNRNARRNIRQASAVLTNSHFAAAQAAAAYGIACAVCYLGVNTDCFRPLSLPAGNYLLSVGAVHYYKGYRFLVRALARLPAASRPRLIIAANSADADELSAVTRLAAELGVALSVRRVTADQELAMLYNQALAFVYAPHLEPWGLAAVEAMACGTPVVAVGEGGVLESVVDGETGVLTPRDEDAYAAALHKLLSRRECRQQLGRQAAQHARACFPWSRTVDCIERFLAAQTFCPHEEQLRLPL